MSEKHVCCTCWRDNALKQWEEWQSRKTRPSQLEIARTLFPVQAMPEAAGLYYLHEEEEPSDV